ncbi:MAG: phosphate acyltransferase, partial [Acidobacteriota bacterium]|nr:phosphate acyltransferase [Acidobacteriota bacterium]
MNRLDAILQRATDLTALTGRRIVLPEGEDPRIQAAAEILRERKIVQPIVLSATDLGTVSRDRLTREMDEARSGKDSRPEVHERWLTDPLYVAAAMVRMGEAEGAVAGACHATSDILRAALQILGAGEGVRTVSSFFMIELPAPTAGGQRLLAFADCGLVPSPDAAQLAEIATATARSYRQLTDEQPKVALLSFSTHGSATDPSVTRVREARNLIAEQSPDFLFDGELQLDAAIVPEVAATKANASPLEGQANVLIFPDLNSGNIGYKLAERLGGAQA